MQLRTKHWLADALGPGSLTEGFAVQNKPRLTAKPNHVESCMVLGSTIPLFRMVPDSKPPGSRGYVLQQEPGRQIISSAGFNGKLHRFEEHFRELQPL